MNSKPLKLRLLMLPLLGLLMSPTAWAQQSFPTPEAAADALVAALGSKEADAQRLAVLFGPDWRDYIPVGSVDRVDVDAFIAGYRKHHTIQKLADGHAEITIGTTVPWSLPLPLVKGGAGWHFDAKAGAEQIRIRRIGRNELDTMQSLLALHDAQMDYAESDRDNDGVLEYAQKLLSSPGEHDGLYWDDDESGEISPLGPLYGDAQPGSEWHGYYYRLLPAQGPSAPGGAYSFRLGENMSRGFAVIAWPASYGDSGVMSFMLSHEGDIFQKDLGPKSDGIARTMAGFDPDSSWDEVPADNLKVAVP